MSTLMAVANKNDRAGREPQMPQILRIRVARGNDRRLAQIIVYSCSFKCKRYRSG